MASEDMERNRQLKDLVREMQKQTRVLEALNENLVFMGRLMPAAMEAFTALATLQKNTKVSSGTMPAVNVSDAEAHHLCKSLRCYIAANHPEFNENDCPKREENHYRKRVQDERKPCKGTNSNVCVAEGCYNEACLKLA